MRSSRMSLTMIVVLLFTSICVAQERTTERKAINLPRGSTSTLPFSDAVMVGNTLYISGRLGIDLNTRKAPDDVKDEVKLLLDGYKTLLAQASLTMDNLVTVTIYCPDLSLYSTFNEVYRSYFSKDFPARAFIGSGPLLFGAHFEMQGIAVK